MTVKHCRDEANCEGEAFFFFDRSFFAECTVPRRAYACEQVITRVKKRRDGKSMWDELEKICKWG